MDRSRKQLLLSLTNTTNLLYDAGLSLLYPQSCAICGASVESRFDGVICAACWGTTQTFADDDTLCWKCGTPARARVASLEREQVRCRRCDETAFTAARACGAYAGALRASVLALKREPHVPRHLVLLMYETYQRAPLNQATLIIPVPLHPLREKERGFNQAALLANALSKLARLPVAEHALARAQRTGRHRAGMDARARHESVEDAFAVMHPRAIAGEYILLMDDVFTTGATVSACSRVLFEAGAEQVLVLTVARPLDRVL